MLRGLWWLIKQVPRAARIVYCVIGPWHSYAVSDIRQCKCRVHTCSRCGWFGGMAFCIEHHYRGAGW